MLSPDTQKANKTKTKGFKITQKEPKDSNKPPKNKRIPLVITDTQYKYLETLAARKSQNVGFFILDLLESHLDYKLLIGDLEWNIPDEHRPNRELVNTLKALMYGELVEDDKLTREDVAKVSELIGCPYEDVVKLLEKHTDSRN